MPGHDVNVAEIDGVHPSDKASSRDRLVELMNRYEHPLAGYLLVLLADRDAVRDCSQEAFLRAYENLERGKVVNSQWLYKVARNQAIDQLRHRGRVRVDDGVLRTIEAPEPVASDRITAVRRAMAMLSPDDREILYLFVVDRFETAEIATMLGIRAGAARVRLHRARERFRAVYGKEVA
jgi:RNA polymerase sigma-70 factor (ECF subfamily)